jgi:ATP-dependent Clp protease protease subunit
VSQLLWLEADNPDKPITLYINSPGGQISSGEFTEPPPIPIVPSPMANPPGLAIYDTMTYIRPPVSTVCVGAASSMAALLLVGGEAGKRFALPHSSVMIHQPLGGTQGQASDILIYANQIQRVRDQVNEIYRHHVNKALGEDRFNAEMVAELMDRDKYLTAQEAKDMGIVDEILLKREVKKEGEESKT